MEYLMVSLVFFLVSLFVWERFFEEKSNQDALDYFLKFIIALFIAIIWPVSLPLLAVAGLGYGVMLLASRGR